MTDRVDTDAVLRSAMLANHIQEADEKIDFEGDLWRPLKEKQREEADPLKMLSEVGGEARDHLLFDVAFPHVAHAATLLGGAVITAGYETIAKAFETMHEGKELNLALKRECAVGACAILCKSALPEGFRTDLRQQFAVKGEFSAGTEAVSLTLLTRPDAARIQQGLVANCRDGQRYAIDRGLTSAAALRVALEQNPEFANRYHHDLAFKLGTDSVVWASAHLELPTLELQLPPAPAPTVVEVRG